MTLREKIKNIVYEKYAPGSWSPEQEEWTNKIVDAILSAVKKAMPPKQEYAEILDGKDWNWKWSEGYNACLSDIIKLLE